MQNKINVLVTAVGSEVGQGVIKALKISKYDCEIISCDMDPDAAGFFMSDKHYLVPKATSKDYLSEMLMICERESVDIIFPNADLELEVISSARSLFEEKGIELVVQPVDILKIFLSKYNTYEFLKKNDITVPNTAKLNDDNEFSELKFPIIVKPNFGQGSKSLYLINDKEEFVKYSTLFEGDGYIAQEYIPSEDEEYTCAVFNHELMDDPYFVIFKRKLKNGTSGVAEVVYDENLRPLFRKICNIINLNGSLNVQFRKFKNKPFIFEINARYSSTTGIRSKCGFNDVEMAIDSFLFNKTPEKPKIVRKKIVRYLEEIYIDI